MFKKTISLILSLSLILTQPIFAQGVAELNIGKYLSQMPALNTDRFRPPQLRYISYDLKSNDFKLLLDQGGLEKSPGHQDIRTPEKSENTLKIETQNLFNYFLIGLTLPNDKFWVNLRPDAPEQIIDPELEKTDLGKIMLEADLQLKKDTASLTSPQTPEGKAYWDKLYKRAGELFGTQNITIPTITRPWIVPGEVIIRESEDSSYIYKANLKVMLEEDYLSFQPSAVSGQQYTFNDPRMKELNQYSTQLIRELILPKLTQEVNTSKRYAPLRQVFFSLILSRWFKTRYRSQRTENREQRTEKANNYFKLIDSGNLTNLTSKEKWNKDYYFNEYKKSFQQGEYNLKEQITTPTGQVIRSYISGGEDLTGNSKPLIEGGFKAGSPILTEIKKYALSGLLILVVSGAFLGGSILNHLSEPTGIIENQERWNAIAAASHNFLNNLYKIAKEGDSEAKVEEMYLNWKRTALSDLDREQRKKVIEALNKTIESLSRSFGNNEKLINVLNQAQELLKKEETSSSPLTPSSIKPAEEVGMKYSSSSTREKNIGRIVEKLNQEYERYNSTSAKARHLFFRIEWPYLAYYAIKNETDTPVIIESLLKTQKQVANAWRELNDPEDESPLKSDYMAALLEASNNFSNEIVAAIKELKQLSAMGDTGGSSPLNAQEMAKEFYDDVINTGVYKTYSAFSHIYSENDIRNVLVSLFKEKYPQPTGTEVKVVRKIIEEHFLIEFNADHPEDSIISLKESDDSSLITLIEAKTELENIFKDYGDIVNLATDAMLEDTLASDTLKVFSERMLIVTSIIAYERAHSKKSSEVFKSEIISALIELMGKCKYGNQLSNDEEIIKEMKAVFVRKMERLNAISSKYLGDTTYPSWGAYAKEMSEVAHRDVETPKKAELKKIISSFERNFSISKYVAVFSRNLAMVSDLAVADISEYLELRILQYAIGSASSAIGAALDSKNQEAGNVVGGIDFTRINYLTQPMGSFQGLDLRLPLLSKAELEGIDISREMAAMEQMINAKIDVSTDRLKCLLAAMSQKGAFNAQRETQLLPLLLRLCWLKEEGGVETTPDFRAVLLITDTGLFAAQGKKKHSLN